MLGIPWNLWYFYHTTVKLERLERWHFPPEANVNYDEEIALALQVQEEERDY